MICSSCFLEGSPLPASSLSSTSFSLTPPVLPSLHSPSQSSFSFPSPSHPLSSIFVINPLSNFISISHASWENLNIPIFLFLRALGVLNESGLWFHVTTTNFNETLKLLELLCDIAPPWVHKCLYQICTFKSSPSFFSVNLITFSQIWWRVNFIFEFVMWSMHVMYFCHNRPESESFAAQLVFPNAKM